jgi:hypothetical protein
MHHVTLTRLRVYYDLGISSIVRTDLMAAGYFGVAQMEGWGTTCARWTLSTKPIHQPIDRAA